MRDDSEIQTVLDRVLTYTDVHGIGSTKYPSMTYEQGLRDALDWVLENSDEPYTEE